MLKRSKRVSKPTEKMKALLESKLPVSRAETSKIKKKHVTRVGVGTSKKSADATNNKNYHVEEVSEEIGGKKSKRQNAKCRKGEKQESLKVCKELVVRIEKLQTRLDTNMNDITRNKNVKKVINSPAVSTLRMRKFVQYAESSIEMSQKEPNTSNTKRVPIYKQPLKEVKSRKRKADQYEFYDSDGEKNKRKSDDGSLENLFMVKLNKTRKKKVCDPKRNRKKLKNNAVNKAHQNNVKKVEERPKNEKCGVEIMVKPKAVVEEIMEKPKAVVEKIVEKPQVKKIERLEDKRIEEKPVVVNEVEEEPEINNEPFVPDDPEDGDEYFGFATNENNIELPKIQILSDIQLQPGKELNVSIGSPACFYKGRPTANSTMLLNSVLIPWRFNDINIRRNPHFIKLKDSSLPCMNQEMVLDHTFVDRFEENTPTKKVKKTNSQNKENTPSLFDINLSPIKTQKKLSFFAPVSAKRRILGEKNENTLDYFGFGTSDKENSGVEVPVRNKEDRPFRFSINVNDKKYKGRKVKKVVEKITEEELQTDEESCTSGDEVDSRELKLFEDFTNTQDRLEINDSILTKESRRRFPQKHKKRKDVRTKEEEEEADRWATAFNSMCEEIDEFQLEVE